MSVIATNTNRVRLVLWVEVDHVSFTERRLDPVVSDRWDRVVFLVRRGRVQRRSHLALDRHFSDAVVAVRGDRAQTESRVHRRANGERGEIALGEVAGRTS